MKVKEIGRTANVAWSPAAQHPVYLAAGTAAQQLDATFSTSAALEIYALNLSEPGLDMEQVGSLPSDVRFHKLCWGSYGMSGSESVSGVLVGGADKGKVFVWNPAKLLQGEESLMHTLEKHSGPVAALDFNTFQDNLLATGASESEIYIWDLNNPTSPMTPGAKSQPPDDVTCVAWNKQVQHILSSTYAGRCVVWDLRKNEPIIKISDSMSRIKCKLVAWHPDVATQLCMASEDDHTPVIQLWDLRFATSPLKNLENHHRGILSMAWCPQDPDLLLSCGKDNRILCWNPNSNAPTGEVVYELPTSNQWSFDVDWCPRNPGVISSCSFDGHISIYSLMGGIKPVQPTNKITDSFPADPFSQTPQQQTTSEQATMALQKPPKWLRRPVGASFGFGGKLISFENVKVATMQQQQPQSVPRQVHISQVVTEPDLISRSNQLESALANSQFSEFCALKIANSKNDMEENIWSFLKVNFEKDPRTHYLELLGHDQTELARKVAEATGSEVKVNQQQGVDANELAHKMSMLGASGESLSADQLSSSGQASPSIQEDQVPQENGTLLDATAAFDQIAAQDQDSRPDSPLPIAINNDVDGLITEALLTANFEAAVEMCLHDDRMAEAIILAIAGGPELLARTQKRYFHKQEGYTNRLISSIVSRDYENVVRRCKLEHWKEAMAVALTYSKADEFSSLCGILGGRLETEEHGKYAADAILCYVCAGDVERLVECWAKHTPNTCSPVALQDLVEKVMVLQKAVELAQGQAQAVRSGYLAQSLSKYAEMLAAQGSLMTAMTYLGDSNEISLAQLRDRMYYALGDAAQGFSQPACPFQVTDVQQQQQQVPQPQVAVAQSQPQQVQRQRIPSGPGYHQATAGTGSFQTTTTPSSTYYTQSQYSGYNSATAQPHTYTTSTGFYNPGQPATSTAAPISKGPLAHKYPTPTHTAPYDPYGQTNYASYDQQGYGGGVYGGSQPQPAVIFNPAGPGAPGQTPGGPYTPPANTGNQPSLPSFQEMRPEGAWNDPPMLRSKKEGNYTPVDGGYALGTPQPLPNYAQEPQQIYDPVAPITQPLYGVPNSQEQTPPGAPNYGQLYNPQEYQPQQPAPQQQQPQPPPPKPEPPKPKGPIPAEHQVLKDIFDQLANMCLANAVQPQMKRKLEEVLRKLEALYDKLRSSALSPNVILGLHQIIQAIQNYDYQTGLAYHTQMISQGNFSEISSFMPGIKVLLQTATQLQVYVQPAQ